MTENAGFFDDLDGVETGIKDGTYPATVFKSEIIEVKKKNTVAWVVTYKIQDGPSKGEPVQEWFTKPPAGSTAEDIERAKKWRARRLESLGIPESQFAKFQPNQVIGEDVVIGVKNNGSYTNVSSVRLASAVNGATNSAPAATAAAVSTPAQVSDLL